MTLQGQCCTAYVGMVIEGRNEPGWFSRWLVPRSRLTCPFGNPWISPETHAFLISLRALALIEKSNNNTREFKKFQLTMNEEVHSKISSERTSSEATLLGKEHQYDETSEPPRRRPSWRRYIMPLCVHIIVFFTYSSIVLLVLNFRSGGSRHNPNILYCMPV